MLSRNRSPGRATSSRIETASGGRIWGLLVDLSWGPSGAGRRRWRWSGSGCCRHQARLIRISRKVREPAAGGLAAGSSRQLKNYSIAPWPCELRTGRQLPVPWKYRHGPDAPESRISELHPKAARSRSCTRSSATRNAGAVQGGRSFHLEAAT